MPIYEYRCPFCQHQFELLQKMNEPPLMRCPNCQRDGLEKLISAANFHLKGGGWYKTDYKKTDKMDLAGTTGAPSSSSSVSGDIKKTNIETKSDKVATSTSGDKK